MCVCVCVCVCVIDGEDNDNIKNNMKHNTNIKDNIKDDDVLFYDNPNTEDKEHDRYRNGMLMMEEARTLTMDEAQTLMIEEAQTLLRLYPPMPLNLLRGGGS